MKQFFFVLPFLPTLLLANPLDQYQWKNRVILINASSTPRFKKEFKAHLKKHHKGVSERNLILIDISLPSNRLPELKRPPVADILQLRKELKINPKIKENSFILIGKDGGVKARQTDQLNLLKFFSLIDRMPMRQAEMRHPFTQPDS